MTDTNLLDSILRPRTKSEEKQRQLEQKAEIRKTALKLRHEGKTFASISKELNVSRNTVQRWWSHLQVAGTEAVIAVGKHGAAVGKNRILSAAEELELRTLISENLPGIGSIRLPFGLWERDAVRELIQRTLKLDVSIRTVSNYLIRWGINPKKPPLYPDWRENEYRGIDRRAKKEGAEIFWGGEIMVPDYAQRQYGRPIPSRVLLYAITNRDKILFMYESQNLKETSQTWGIFLKNLAVVALRKKPPRKAFLILARPLPEYTELTSWLLTAKDKIEIFYMPSYSLPETTEKPKPSPAAPIPRVHLMER